MEEIEHPCPQLSVLGPLYPITTVAQWKGEETTNESGFPSTSHLSVPVCVLFLSQHISQFFVYACLRLVDLVCLPLLLFFSYSMGIGPCCVSGHIPSAQHSAWLTVNVY